MHENLKVKLSSLNAESLMSFKWKAISCGTSHTCAILMNGSAVSAATGYQKVEIGAGVLGIERRGEGVEVAS